jgi:hypothetical protein
MATSRFDLEAASGSRTAGQGSLSCCAATGDETLLLPRPISLALGFARRPGRPACQVGRARHAPSRVIASRHARFGAGSARQFSRAKRQTDSLRSCWSRAASGLPPLFMQAEHASRRGLVDHCEMIYGGRTSRDLVLLGEMRGLGLSNVPGHRGRFGRPPGPRDGRPRSAHRPPPRHRESPAQIAHSRLRSARNAVGRGAHRRAQGIECYLSMEEQMACGIGVCLGCAIPGSLAAIPLHVQRRSGVPRLGSGHSARLDRTAEAAP